LQAYFFLGVAAQAIAEPHRRFIEIFEGVREVRDLFQPLPSKTERIVYLMNDCMLVRTLTGCDTKG